MSEKLMNGNTPMTTFASWLADVLQGCKSDVDRLLEDETALHFLIAWSALRIQVFFKLTINFQWCKSFLYRFLSKT